MFHPASDFLYRNWRTVKPLFLLAVLHGRQNFLIVDDVLFSGPDFLLALLDTAVEIGNIPVFCPICCCPGCLCSVLEIFALAIFLKAFLILSEHLFPPTCKCLTSSMTSNNRLGKERNISVHPVKGLLQGCAPALCVLCVLFVTLGPSLSPICLTLHLFGEGQPLTLPLFLGEAQLGSDLFCPPQIRFLGPTYPTAPGTTPEERTFQIGLLVCGQGGILGFLKMQLNFGRFQIEDIGFHPQTTSFTMPYTSST